MILDHPPGTWLDIMESERRNEHPLSWHPCVAGVRVPSEPHPSSPPHDRRTYV